MPQAPLQNQAPEFPERRSRRAPEQKWVEAQREMQKSIEKRTTLLLVPINIRPTRIAFDVPGTLGGLDKWNGNLTLELPTEFMSNTLLTKILVQLGAKDIAWAPLLTNFVLSTGPQSSFAWRVRVFGIDTDLYL